MQPRPTCPRGASLTASTAWSRRLSPGSPLAPTPSPTRLGIPGCTPTRTTVARVCCASPCRLTTAMTHSSSLTSCSWPRRSRHGAPPTGSSPPPWRIWRRRCPERLLRPPPWRQPAPFPTSRPRMDGALRSARKYRGSRVSVRGAWPRPRRFRRTGASTGTPASRSATSWRSSRASSTLPAGLDLRRSSTSFASPSPTRRTRRRL